MNQDGHKQRSISSAWMIGFGNTGGIVATFCFQAKDVPHFYHLGYSICMGVTCMGILAVVLYAGFVILENKKMGRSDGKGDGKKLSL